MARGGPIRPWHAALFAAALLMLSAVFLLFRAVTSARPGAGPGATPGAKKAPPVNMVAEVGAAGCARRGRLTPVRVTLGQNDSPVRGRLVLDDLGGRRTEMPVDLPRRANKAYTLFARLRPVMFQRGASARLTLREGGRVLAEQLLTPSYPDRDALVVLTAAPESGGLKFLHDGRTRHVAHLAPRDLPSHWAGYEPADVVALNGRAWSEMDEAQRRALRMWVEQGGRAILCGESPADWNDADGRTLAAVAPRDTTAAAGLQSVATWAGGPYRARGGRLLTVTGPTAPGTTVLGRENGRPLLAARRAVRGRALWIGFDAFRESLREWDGYESFWRGAIEQTRRDPDAPAVPPSEQLEGVREAAGSLPRLPAPPVPALIGFGVAYAVIFGPVNAWVLRRMRRTVRSWFFMPLLAAGMTLVVLLAGQSWGNARTVLNSITLLETASGSRTACDQTLLGFFSPTNRSFDVAADDPAADLADAGTGEADGGGPADPWPARQDEDGTRWDGFALQLYSTRVMRSARPRDLGGPLEARLEARGRGLPTGAIRNDTPLALENAYLYYSGWYHSLGPLPAGSAAAVGPRGWSSRPPAAPPRREEPAALVENRRFQELLRGLRDGAPSALLSGPARGDAWLIAECPGYDSGLRVPQVPYSNRGTLLLMRIPR